MYLIRPWILDDFHVVFECANQARGLTSLPKNETILKKRLIKSVASFSPKIHEPGDEYYGFALMNTETNEVCGVSAIIGSVGIDHPEYLYEIIEDELYPFSHFKGPSELCSLFLLQPHRKGGLGKLLSLSRLHFIAAFPHRFQKYLVALMRGFINDNKESPFWNALDHKHLDLAYDEIEARLATSDPSLKSLLPTKPLKISSLPPDAQNAIGKTHPNTVVALKLLENEGFRWKGFVDIIDAGPQISAEVTTIRTIRESKLYDWILSDTVPSPESKTFLISNNRLDFRALIAQLEINEKNQVLLTKELVQLLKVKEREPIRISPLHHESSSV